MVVGQAIFYIVVATTDIDINDINLVGNRLMSGDVVGIAPLFLYPFVPPDAHPVIVLLVLYVTYFIAKYLENSWGSFKFTFYVFISYVIVVGACFIFPNRPVYSEFFFSASLFVAFAYMSPNFVFHLFLLFPIKVKWLGLLTWLMMWFLLFSSEDMLIRVQVVSAMLPFFMFYGKDLFIKLRQKKKRSEYANLVKVVEGSSRHKCVECTRTEISDPELDFRYKEVDGSLICYCIDHVPND